MSRIHVTHGSRKIARLLLLAFAATISTSTGFAQERESQDVTPLNETEKIRHLLSRFSFGPTPGLVEKVRKMGIDRWFEEQLKGELQEGQELGERLAGYSSLDLDGKELMKKFRTPRGEPGSKQRKESDRLRNIPRTETRNAVIIRSIYGANQVREVASDFFRNHLNVDVNKGELRYILPDWEREVIRNEALGNFGDMLAKSSKHPAMLVYLDNALSRRPLSKAELKGVEINTRVKTGSRERGEESVQIAMQRGLNENYARELLELHTLGVDNGYKQKDVIEVAKILTGWTADISSAKFGFCFKPSMHCIGEKWVLGKRYRGSKKEEVTEGEKLIANLVREKGTADFLAWKLCRFFVDDNPPEAMVKRVARVFKSSKGKLPSVYRAIYKDPEFFKPRWFQSKFKRPFEFLVSTIRATGAEVSSTDTLHKLLAELSEPIYECEDPTGYYDQAEAWRDPGVMAVRWRFAMDLAHGRVKGVRIPDSFYEGLHPKIHRAWKDQLAERLLPAGMSEQTQMVLDSVVREHLDLWDDPRPEQLGPVIVGLLLGSPEFQRQ